MVNKQRWKCWNCMSLSWGWGGDTSELTILIVSFGLPIIITPSIFTPLFCLAFFILLSQTTVITPVPMPCIMVSAPPTAQWIKLYLEPLWSLDEGGRCLCGVIIITQWSCCHQPCHRQLKRHDCVLGPFSPVLPLPPPTIPAAPSPAASLWIGAIFWELWNHVIGPNMQLLGTVRQPL